MAQDMDRILGLLKEAGSQIVPFKWDGEDFFLLDQRLLPEKEEWICCKTWQDAAAGIKDMVVRGAPAIGITAAFAVVLAIRQYAKGKEAQESIAIAARKIEASRPTAINLVWAVRRMLKSLEGTSRENLYERSVSEALSIWEEDVRANIAMGLHGGKLIEEGTGVLTHCNAGALATGGYGTALGVIRGAIRLGKHIEVHADETRPWLQGARLTAWELIQDGIEVSLNVDMGAGVLLKASRIGAVVVGADRIAANGDVANKIGTYTLAVLCKENGVPFYVAAPSSTFDHQCSCGDEIPIEERPGEEVVKCRDRQVAAKGVRVFNPVFDVTPNELVTAIVTEQGVLRPPYDKSISTLPH